MEKEAENKEKCSCMEEECTCVENGECSCHSEKHECHCESSKEDKKNKKEKKDKSKKEIEELKEQIKDLENKILAEKAEVINYKKRNDAEYSYKLKYANEDLAKELIMTVDNFERAIKLDDDNLEDELSKFLEGFKMIYCNLVKTLENYGVKAIDGSNKPFDPTYHQAVMTENREGVESGMVLEVMQKGYLLKDKVIRPAMVKVSE